MLPEPKKMLIFCLLAFQLGTFSQTEVDGRDLIHFHKGLVFKAPDSAFGVIIRLRMQNRVRFNADEAFSIQDIEARVSRLRLRLDGYILCDKIQLPAAFFQQRRSGLGQHTYGQYGAQYHGLLTF